MCHFGGRGGGCVSKCWYGRNGRQSDTLGDQVTPCLCTVFAVSMVPRLSMYNSSHTIGVNLVCRDQCAHKYPSWPANGSCRFDLGHLWTDSCNLPSSEISCFPLHHFEEIPHKQ